MAKHISVIPRFTRMLEDQYVKENEVAEFSCEVYPENSPIIWKFHGTDVDSNLSKYETHAIGKSRSLVIKDAREDDAGMVSAVVGDSDSHADLHVEGMLPILVKEVYSTLPFSVKY